MEQRKLVDFYDTVDDALLSFALIISKNNGKMVLCKHKKRDTYEVPGGRREPGEKIIDNKVSICYFIRARCMYSEKR